MAKSNPSVTNSVGATAAAGDVKVRSFLENQHRGHPVTRVGTFTDLDRSNDPYEVWYCQKDHVLVIC